MTDPDRTPPADPAPRYDSWSVPVPGGDLYIGRWSGRPGAPVVVAAHGITGNHLSWAPVAAALGDAVTLLAPDLRGRAGSAGVAGPFGIARHADDLAAVADAAGVERPVLVGHSMGGFVVTTAVTRHPGRFGPVVLVDGGVALTADPPAADAAEVDARLAALLGPALARLDMTFETEHAYVNFFHEHPALAPIWSAYVEAYARHDLAGTPPRLHSSCVAAAIRADGADILLDPEVVGAVFDAEVHGSLVWAGHGMFGQAGGLFDAARLARLGLPSDRLRTRELPAANHYSILLDPAWAAEVAAEVTRACG